ncbi:MAG: TIR domain-containing protein [Byssovorax sp.]
MTDRFPEDLVRELHSAAIWTDLDRKALLAGVPPAFTASLQHADTRAAQILLDLRALNRVGALIDGTVPLQIWLTNAAALTPSRSEGAVFEKALGILKQPRVAELPPPRPTTQPPETTRKDPAVQIFISACDADQGFVGRLEMHLFALRRARLITLWHRGLLLPGSLRTDEIARALDGADIVLAIVSTDYLAREETYHEVEQALQVGKTVIPILARPADLRMSPFATRKALPYNGVPVSQWPDADSAFLEIAQAISSLVETRAAGARRGA